MGAHGLCTAAGLSCESMPRACILPRIAVGSGKLDPNICHIQHLQAHALVGHDQELVADGDQAGLALSHHDGAHLLVLIDDRHPEWRHHVALEWVRRVQHLPRKQTATSEGSGIRSDYLHSIGKVRQQVWDQIHGTVPFWFLANTCSLRRAERRQPGQSPCEKSKCD